MHNHVSCMKVGWFWKNCRVYGACFQFYEHNLSSFSGYHSIINFPTLRRTKLTMQEMKDSKSVWQWFWSSCVHQCVFKDGILHLADSLNISFDHKQLECQFPHFSIGCADFFHLVLCGLWILEKSGYLWVYWKYGFVSETGKT